VDGPPHRDTPDAWRPGASNSGSDSVARAGLPGGAVADHNGPALITRLEQWSPGSTLTNVSSRAGWLCGTMAAPSSSCEFTAVDLRALKLA
jgi:hypothetical protein